MEVSPSAVLSPSQMEVLARIGDEREAAEGDVLFRVGDETYPFIAIREGEAAVLDPAGKEIVRHGAFGFLGEMNLLSGQRVYLTAVATRPMRYVAVPREDLRALLFEDSSLADLLLGAFVRRRELLSQRVGVGIEIIGPRDSDATRRLADFARRIMLPHAWRVPAEDDEAARIVEGRTDDELPLVRVPGAPDLVAPSPGELSRSLGIGLELDPVEEVDLAVIGGGPAGLGAAVYGASEGLRTLVVDKSALGGQARSSRRIENYLGFPAGITGTELTSRAIAQSRKFGARTATPYEARGLSHLDGRHVVALDDGRELHARAVVLATGADYRRLPVAGLGDYEGISVFYAAGPPEGRLCGGQRVAVVGGGNSAGQAAVWLARGGALVTLLHRRGDLAETMSRYLITELEQHGVAIRGRSEIAELHGEDGRLGAVTLLSGERLPFSYLFLFLGADPCTGWVGESVERDDHGFVITGGAGDLETSKPGVYAAGDVRSGSTKRCATAVGEGAAVVRLVHQRLARV
jgi:thioredoxin reductase (NADPH)